MRWDFIISREASLRCECSSLLSFLLHRYPEQTWGLAIGAAIIQNALLARLPPDFLSQVEEQANLSGLLSLLQPATVM